MELKQLKKGDKINHVQYGHGIHKARVIENFPEKNKVYLSVAIGLWGIIRIKTIAAYGDYYFDLINE